MSYRDSGGPLSEELAYATEIQATSASSRLRERRTSVLVVELQEVPLLVQLVAMAVEEGEDGLELRNGVLADIHAGRLVGLKKRKGS